MINREQLFLKYLPPELGPMVISALIKSKRLMKVSEERIDFSLYEEDVEYLINKTQSDILSGAIDWGATEQGYYFWKSIYDSLVEKEKLNNS